MGGEIPRLAPSQRVQGREKLGFHDSTFHEMQLLKAMLSTTLRCAYCSPASTLRLKKKLFSSSSSSSCLKHPQWSGLQNWRENPINHNRFWGPSGPQSLALSGFDEVDDGPMALSSSLAEMGALVLNTADPLTKSKLSHMAYSLWRRQNLPIGVSQPPHRPARSPKPQLNCFPKGNSSSQKVGFASQCLYANLAHVELNAIDLAWDTVVRFSPHSELLGEGFFADFAHVADDESRHFAWCSQRLAELGFSYGDMPAHNLLWRECEKSSHNVAARLAAIPLVQ
ncbi:unnamed protein product [Camellia sinensis]